MREQQFFEDVYASCQANPSEIVLPESHDDRVVDAANTVASRGITTPRLIVEDTAPENVHDDVVVDQASPDDALIDVIQSRRDLSRDEARERLYDPVTYAMGLVADNRVDGCVCGANHPTKETYSAALSIVGSRDDVDLVSTTFLMFWHDTLLFFADCALNIDPSAADLARIAEETVRTAHKHDVSPRVAMLSYSTRGSGGGASPHKVRKATKTVEAETNCNVLGEVQFDTAFDPSVREQKMGETGRRANIYVFPSLDAGNIGYKIAQQLGGASAIGPITQGLRRPVNDLSRGCTTQEIIETIGLTAYGS